VTVTADLGGVVQRADMDDQRRRRYAMAGPVDPRRHKSIDAAQV
jgi:hypothetical protein